MKIAFVLWITNPGGGFHTVFVIFSGFDFDTYIKHFVRNFAIGHTVIIYTN